jgi:hypothetical protein
LTENDVIKAAWSFRFNLAVTLLKWSAKLAPRNVQTIRMIADNKIPPFMCYSGVDIKLNATIVPGNGTHAPLMGEIYHRQKKPPSGTKYVDANFPPSLIFLSSISLHLLSSY